ncbi:MAG: hypothetical protein IJX38_02605 [Clostridia bacterium]|nr:hypothetical protein [Clostridia bacterium]
MSKFKILWIDDQTKKCRREVKAVSNLIKALGFEPEIAFETEISKSSLSEVNGALYKAIHARDVDLFLVDYNLKNDVFGSDIVRQIRSENDIYTDIIFYSNDRRALVDQIKGSYDAESSLDFCDGVYVVPLGNEFITKVEQVITKTIKSWYNVHSIRGILLSKASKFEQMVSKIINDHYINYIDEIKQDLVDKGERVCRTIKSRWGRVKNEYDPVPQVLSDPIHFNWATKKMMLERLGTSGAIDISVWEDIDIVFDLRNLFAHNPIHLKDGELVVTTIEGEQIFNEADIDVIRKRLVRIEADLQKYVPSSGAAGVLPEIISEDDQFEEMLEEIFDESKKKELAKV